MSIKKKNNETPSHIPGASSFRKVRAEMAPSMGQNQDTWLGWSSKSQGGGFPVASHSKPSDFG